MGEVMKNMQELFNDYNKEVAGESHRDGGTQEVQDDNDPLAEWDQYKKSKRQQSRARSIFERTVDTPKGGG